MSAPEPPRGLQAYWTTNKGTYVFLLSWLEQPRCCSAGGLKTHDWTRQFQASWPGSWKTQGARSGIPLFNIPDEPVEEQRCVADDACGAGLLVLTPLQGQAVIHVTFSM